MITCVTFARTVPVTVNKREDRFEAVDGFVIEEVEPGRVRVSHEAYGTQLHQDVPYTLFTAPDPVVESEKPSPTPPSAAGSDVVELKPRKRR